jgi:NAD(P)-dependent dehydrogenase (short-subunit alcohol dehydrogenase family)
MTDFGIAKKVVIVTGGAGGLGRAFAEAFLRAEASVVIADIDDAGARSIANVLGASGKRCIGLGVDITDENSVERMLERAQDSFGSINVLINNAAIYGAAYRKPFFEISGDEWDRVLSVNLKGAFLCCKAVYRYMRGGGGKIINIASASVMSGSPLWLHYVSSKGGLIAMTRALASEMGTDKVTVNAIAPGFTLTEASIGAIADAATYGVDRGAIKRAEQPEDVVGAALWLASPHSDFVTGQTLVVDGGRQFH